MIFQQPHYRYLLRSWHPTLDEIEQLVPGVLAWARFGRRKIRVGAKLDDFLADSPWLQPTEYEVFVPVNAGYLVEHYLTRVDIRPHQRDARYIDGMIETMLHVLDDMGAYEAVIAKDLDRYLPFLTTTTLLMEAVQRGAGREQAHEAIKEHALATALEMREKGLPENDLAERLGSDARFPLETEEIKEE